MCWPLGFGFITYSVTIHAMRQRTIRESCILPTIVVVQRGEWHEITVVFLEVYAQKRNGDDYKQEPGAYDTYPGRVTHVKQSYGDLGRIWSDGTVESMSTIGVLYNIKL